MAATCVTVRNRHAHSAGGAQGGKRVERAPCAEARPLRSGRSVWSAAASTHEGRPGLVRSPSLTRLALISSFSTGHGSFGGQRLCHLTTLSAWSAWQASCGM